MQGRLIAERFWFANHAHAGSGRIQMSRSGRIEPVFELPDQLLLLFHMFDFGKAAQIGVRLKLGRQRPVAAQEKNGRFFQALLALG